MKMKLDFVSNSSSTSYCIYGVYLNSDKLRDLVSPDSSYDDDYELMEEVYNFFNKTPAVFQQTGCGGVLGLNATNMGLNETLYEFKARVAGVVNNALGGPKVTTNDITLEYGEYYNE